MTVTITYICDRCKKAQPTRIESGGHTPLWKVSIICEPIDELKSKYHYPSRYQEAEWCLFCVDDLKVRRPLLVADVETPNPTLEDIIRAIVRDEQQSE